MVTFVGFCFCVKVNLAMHKNFATSTKKGIVDYMRKVVFDDLSNSEKDYLPSSTFGKF